MVPFCHRAPNLPLPSMFTLSPRDRKAAILLTEALTPGLTAILDRRCARRRCEMAEKVESSLS
jgi:hypothetical protein